MDLHTLQWTLGDRYGFGTDEGIFEIKQNTELIPIALCRLPFNAIDNSNRLALCCYKEFFENDYGPFLFLTTFIIPFSVDVSEALFDDYRNSLQDQMFHKSLRLMQLQPSNFQSYVIGGYLEFYNQTLNIKSHGRARVFTAPVILPERDNLD